MLAQQLHKPMIKNFKRSKVYAKFKDKNYAAYLAKMGSISSKNCDVKYLLWVKEIMAWSVGKFWQ